MFHRSNKVAGGQSGVWNLDSANAASASEFRRQTSLWGAITTSSWRLLVANNGRKRLIRCSLQRCSQLLEYKRLGFRVQEGRRPRLSFFYGQQVLYNMRSKEQKQIYLNKRVDANLRNVTADNAMRKKTRLPGRQPRCKHIRGRAWAGAGEKRRRYQWDPKATEVD